MARKLISREYCACMDDYKCEFICDTDADFETLPPACTGSTAVSIESAKVMVVNTQGEWVVFGEPSGGGDSIVGTWVFNETLTELEPNVQYSIVGECSYAADGTNMEVYPIAYVYRDKPTYYDMFKIVLMISDWEERTINQYNYDTNTWSKSEDKTITITEEPTDETFIAWLKENATKIA